ncbi:MAG: epimerase [Deltaproteobacteria bacterium]|mgnify:CR=1 FL=1|nr:epimerase [Deltaproteobacteria bacterium]MBU49753.1 epimerase [Deltaproteobacteria bacterium]|tara:strand:+ start:3351 stop:4367 length:1017 start_codon:yes stop_codon:yes gene_type:complete
MAVLVTGPAGHIGINLVRALVKQGRDVRALIYRSKQGLEDYDIQFIKGNVLDPDSLKDAMEGVDVVYHLAGALAVDGANEELMYRINVQGTKNVVEACLQQKVSKLIHFSSIRALSYRPLHEVVDESRALALDAKRYPAYDVTKALGEQAVLEGVERGLNACILNPTGVYGPYDYKLSSFGEVLLKLHLRQLPALVPGGFDWVDVRDVVEAALQAEQKGVAGERYLLTGEYASVKKVAQHVHELTGSRPPLITCPYWLAMLGVPFVAVYSKIRSQRPLYTFESLNTLRQFTQLNGQKARYVLGHQPRPLEEGLRDTFEWLRQSHHLSPQQLKEAPIDR